jgi:hypothetical protein
MVPAAAAGGQGGSEKVADLLGCRVEGGGALPCPAHDDRSLDHGDDHRGQARAALLGQAVAPQQCGECVLPAGEDRGRGARQLRGVVVRLHRHRHDRAPGPEAAFNQLRAPQRKEGVECPERITGLCRGINVPGDDVAGQVDCLADQLRPAAGEVVVDRAARGAAVREDPVDTRRARTVFA